MSCLTGLHTLFCNSFALGFAVPIKELTTHSRILLYSGH